MAIFDDTLTDTVSATGAPVGDYAPVVTDRFKSADGVAPVYAQLPSLSETLNLSEALSTQLGAILLESIRISQMQVQNQKSHLTIAENATILSMSIVGYPITLAETIAITPAETVQAAIQVMERLGVADTIVPALSYHLTLSERLVAADSLARFLGADAVDSFTATDALAGVAAMSGSVVETLTIAEALTPLFLLRVTASDAIEIEAADAVQLLLNAELAESIEIAGAYLAPDGSVTTWAMNTRTAGVTEYQNYTFNSFARIGDKYLGASESGLYELTGDTDDGEDIIATIRSGFAQWAGTHLGSFKAAYLAVRGGGDFVLRIITADGNTYNYTVAASEGRNAKVTIGKGLRSRYFAFELVSTGQDFDLDTLEFIPLVVQRRV